MAWYIEGNSEMEDARQRQAWERTRWAAAALLQPHISKGKKLKLTDLVQFPWESASAQAPAAIDEKTREKWEKWDEEMRQAYGK